MNARVAVAGPVPDLAPQLRRERRRASLVLVGSAALLVVAGLLSVAVGARGITPDVLFAVLFDRIGVDLGVAFSEVDASIVLDLRLPRTLGGALVGAGLGVAGAALQGLFRNPLADPGLIGLSSGARLFASAYIVLGATPLLSWAADLGPVALPLFAVAGAWVAVLLVYRLGRFDGRVDVARMLLAGVALAVLAEALSGVLALVAEDPQLRAVTMWSLGSLGGMTWGAVAVLAAGTLVTLFATRYMARTLNVMLLGERDARQLGVSVERTKRWIVALVALAVGVGVAFAGIIGFVGLVVPHVVRLAAGPDHRVVLPGAALLGAAMVLLADVVARTAIAPAELPLGVVTALIGTPFFLGLLLRKEHL